MIPLVPLYKDFLKFLDTSTAMGDLWTNYEKLYFAPHRQFLSSYWVNCIGLGLEEMQARVRSIKPCHYSHLLFLLSSHDLEGMCTATVQKCSSVLSWSEEPIVYLMVGFFSPDGFVIPVEGKPVIGIGLERYRSFGNLPTILAHECCHYMQSLQSHQLDRCTVGEAMLREGTCVVFSRIIFPERPLTEHLGMSRGCLNWMRANERLIWETIKPVISLTGKDAIQRYLYGVPFADSPMAGASMNPSKAGLYMGFRIAEEILGTSADNDIGILLRPDPESVISKITYFFSEVYPQKV